jgi:hypothetical protein
MPSVEIKFLFEGIIFSSNVFIEHISNSLNRYEFTISFFTRYLISKYRDCYFLILENNKFKPIYTQDEKEYELVKTLQEAIINLPQLIREKLLLRSLDVNKLLELPG